MRSICLFAAVGAVVTAGCHYPEVTAVPLSAGISHEQEGIPFYLPKPLLIVSKNFRHIEEPKVGLTDGAPIPHGFDDQAKYADVNARTNFTGGTTTPSPAAPGSSGAAAAPPRLHSTGAPVTPGAVAGDGLAPETFFTYQIVFVPDLTQKYGLKVRGGAGEFRAAMNLVNGWQYTGLGPFYLKDSSTAQNTLATGITANLAATGVADVVDSVANLAGRLQSGDGTVPVDSREVRQVVRTLKGMDAKLRPIQLPNYAEIHVYEPHLTPDGRMEWTEIVGLSFDRTILGQVDTKVKTKPLPEPKAPRGAARGGRLQSGLVNAEFARQVVAHTLGVPVESRALQPVGGLQSGTPATQAGGAVHQIQVDCGNCGKPNCRHCAADEDGPHKTSLLGLFRRRERPRIERRRVTGAGLFSAVRETGTGLSRGRLGGLQSGDATKREVFEQPVLNQPVLNQPRFRTPPPQPKID
ncbi:MAG: hypothetical protein ACE5KM_03075 [Planctomycetaceae bacterium]